MVGFLISVSLKSLGISADLIPLLSSAPYLIRRRGTRFSQVSRSNFHILESLSSPLFPIPQISYPLFLISNDTMINMHKKKKHTTSTVSQELDPDKIALVKAAAWAWHQHSSSPKNKQAPPPEFPSASPRRRSSHRRPSRYRLESLSKSNSPNDHLVPEKTAPITLLDFYEIERITRELDQRLAAVSTEKREKVQGKKVALMRKGTGRGCLFGRHAVMICGSPDTAAETEALVGRRRERSSEILHSA